MRAHLDKFYKLAAKNTNVRHQFEAIVEKKDFLRLLTQLGAKWGYTFTAAEIEASIEACTANDQGKYFCVPLGCWPRPTVN